MCFSTTALALLIISIILIIVAITFISCATANGASGVGRMRIVDMYHHFLNFEDVCDGFRSSVRSGDADWYKMEDGTRWRIGVGSGPMVRPMGMML